MYLCYIDESGTPQVPGTTSHYILAGLAVPIWKWNICESEINYVKAKYDLLDKEIHTGWLIKTYPEQRKISDFETLSYVQRRSDVEMIRRSEILRLQGGGAKERKSLPQVRKTQEKTKYYTHLTFAERKAFVKEIAKVIGNWGFSRLFAECVDKVFFDPSRATSTVDEQAFEQVVSRFEQYLDKVDSIKKCHGLLIHDNNQTVAKRHTELMKGFHKTGTFWTAINNIIETPLFVDSSLTSMIQMADVCGYSIRRYLENGEDDLFNEIFKRAHMKGNKVVGVRHFTNINCKCKICSGHKMTSFMVTASQP